MKYFIFNLVDGDRERAASFLHGKRWVVGRGGRHRDVLASGDLVLVFVAATSEFVGRVKRLEHCRGLFHTPIAA